MDSQLISQWNQIKEYMDHEVKLLDRFVDQEENLNRLVKQRRWGEIEELLMGLDTLAREIDEVEAKRHTQFQHLRAELPAGETASFHSYVLNLPSQLQKELLTLRQKLRISLTKIRSLSRGLFYYFRSMQDSLGQILEEIFPHRKGKIYSREGNISDRTDNPVVINQRT